MGLAMESVGAVTIRRVRYKSLDEDLAGRSSAVSAAFADYNILAGYSIRF